jgi:hypothetical protein
MATDASGLPVVFGPMEKITGLLEVGSILPARKKAGPLAFCQGFNSVDASKTVPLFFHVWKKFFYPGRLRGFGSWL